MKILVTGANGFLAQHLAVYLAGLNFEILATGRRQNPFIHNPFIQFMHLELTDASAVMHAVQAFRPKFIIHAAAMSKPDVCNAEREKCLLNNVTATENIIIAANEIAAKLVYISSDFVFGEGGPHKETDIPAPLNFYGESKLIAEKSVQSSALHFAIVRPVFIYGYLHPGMNATFIHWVKNNLTEGKKIKVVSDQLRTPTYVTDICKGIAAMIANNVTGIYHLAGSETLSPYQMAVTVADSLKLDADLIENVTSETFYEPVVRAKKSGLEISKARLQLGYQPITFKEGIRLSFPDLG